MCVPRLAHPRACRQERGVCPRPALGFGSLVKCCLQRCCSDRLSTASGAGGAVAAAVMRGRARRFAKVTRSAQPLSQPLWRSPNDHAALC
jgi:hypothetical protein